VFPIQAPGSQKEALEKAISKIRNQYTLGFNPLNPGYKGKFHQLAVQFTNPDRCPECKIIARRGYYAGVSPALLQPSKPPAPPIKSPVEVDQELLQRSIFTAGTASLDMEEIQFGYSAKELTDANGEMQLEVDLKINPVDIKLIQTENLRQCKLIVALFLRINIAKYLEQNGGMLKNSLEKKFTFALCRREFPFQR
jgi:hypothetical protein